MEQPVRVLTATTPGAGTPAVGAAALNAPAAAGSPASTVAAFDVKRSSGPVPMPPPRGSALAVPKPTLAVPAGVITPGSSVGLVVGSAPGATPSPGSAALAAPGSGGSTSVAASPAAGSGGGSSNSSTAASSGTASPVARANSASPLPGGKAPPKLQIPTDPSAITLVKAAKPSSTVTTTTALSAATDDFRSGKLPSPAASAAAHKPGRTATSPHGSVAALLAGSPQPQQQHVHVAPPTSGTALGPVPPSPAGSISSMAEVRARHKSFLEQTLQLRGQSFCYVNLLEARGLSPALKQPAAAAAGASGSLKPVERKATATGPASPTLAASRPAVSSSSSARNPYAVIALDSHAKVYSTTMYHTLAPVWDEETSFSLETRHPMLSIEVYSEAFPASDVFLGTVRVPVTEYDADTLHDTWLPLTRRDKLRDIFVSGDLRVRFLYRLRAEDSDELYSAALHRSYDRFVRAVVSPDRLLVSAILGHLHRADVAAAASGAGAPGASAGSEQVLQQLLVIHQHNTFKSTMAFLKQIVAHEIDHTVGVSNLFRRNSFAPKLLALYAWSVGAQFLGMLLRPFVTQIVSDATATGPHVRGFEIDPNRVKPNESLLANQRNLEAACQLLFDTIVAAADEFPVQLRYVGHVLQSVIRAHYERVPATAMVSAAGTKLAAPVSAADAQHAVNTGVHNSLASFFFLRFICPAIVTPVQYGIVGPDGGVAAASKTEGNGSGGGGDSGGPPKPMKGAAALPTKAARVLLLITKTLQSLVNSPHSGATASSGSGGVSSSSGAGDVSVSDGHGLYKEPHMLVMQPFITRNRPKVSQLLQQLSSWDERGVLPSFERLDARAYSRAVMGVHAYVWRQHGELRAIGMKPLRRAGSLSGDFDDEQPHGGGGGGGGSGDGVPRTVVDKDYAESEFDKPIGKTQRSSTVDTLGSRDAHVSLAHGKAAAAAGAKIIAAQTAAAHAAVSAAAAATATRAAAVSAAPSAVSSARPSNADGSGNPTGAGGGDDGLFPMDDIGTMGITSFAPAALVGGPTAISRASNAQPHTTNKQLHMQIARSPPPSLRAVSHVPAPSTATQAVPVTITGTAAAASGSEPAPTPAGSLVTSGSVGALTATALSTSASSVVGGSSVAAQVQPGWFSAPTAGDGTDRRVSVSIVPTTAVAAAAAAGATVTASATVDSDAERPHHHHLRTDSVPPPPPAHRDSDAPPPPLPPRLKPRPAPAGLAAAATPSPPNATTVSPGTGGSGSADTKQADAPPAMRSHGHTFVPPASALSTSPTDARASASVPWNSHEHIRQFWTVELRDLMKELGEPPQLTSAAPTPVLKKKSPDHLSAGPRGTITTLTLHERHGHKPSGDVSAFAGLQNIGGAGAGGSGGFADAVRMSPRRTGTAAAGAGGSGSDDPFGDASPLTSSGGFEFRKKRQVQVHLHSASPGTGGVGSVPLVSSVPKPGGSGIGVTVAPGASASALVHSASVVDPSPSHPPHPSAHALSSPAFSASTSSLLDVTKQQPAAAAPKPGFFGKLWNRASASAAVSGPAAKDAATATSVSSSSDKTAPFGKPKDAPMTVAASAAASGMTAVELETELRLYKQSALEMQLQLTTFIEQQEQTIKELRTAQQHFQDKDTLQTHEIGLLREQLAVQQLTIEQLQQVVATTTAGHSKPKPATIAEHDTLNAAVASSSAADVKHSGVAGGTGTTGDEETAPPPPPPTLSMTEAELRALVGNTPTTSAAGAAAAGSAASSAASASVAGPRPGGVTPLIVRETLSSMTFTPAVIAAINNPNAPLPSSFAGAPVPDASGAAAAGGLAGGTGAAGSAPHLVAAARNAGRHRANSILIQKLQRKSKGLETENEHLLRKVLGLTSAQQELMNTVSQLNTQVQQLRRESQALAAGVAAGGTTAAAAATAAGATSHHTSGAAAAAGASAAKK